MVRPSGARMPQDRNGGGGVPDVMDASPGRTRDHRIGEEQAALRHVAVLVAGGAPPEEVFGAVAEEPPAAGSRLRDPGPVRPAGRDHDRRHVDQNGRPLAGPGRRPDATRRT